MKKSNIKENKLTLKALQEEIDSLKSNGKGKTSSVTRRSLIPTFFIFSTLLAYGHKIPFISKILKIIKFWYGRTTWWKILVFSRKVFVVLNAIIGVITVFYITGFSSDNIIGGISGLGFTYVDMLTSFVKRLFNWFLEFFDMKVIPNPPSNPSAPSWYRWGPKENTWYGKGMTDQFSRITDLAQNQNFYKNPFSVQNSVSTDWSFYNILWYLGVTIITGCVLYGGYVLYTDPYYVKELFYKPFKWGGVVFDQNSNHGSTTPTPSASGNPTGEASTSANPGPSTSANPGPSNTDIIGGASTSTSTSIMSYFGSKMTSFGRSVANIFNPWTYFRTDNQQNTALNMFLETQRDITRQNRRFYPFTENNPFDSFIDKWRKAVFGETSAENLHRNNLIVEMDSEIRRLLSPGVPPEDLEFKSPSSSRSTASNISTTGMGYADAWAGRGAQKSYHEMMQRNDWIRRKLDGLPAIPTTPLTPPPSTETLTSKVHGLLESAASEWGKVTEGERKGVEPIANTNEAPIISSAVSALVRPGVSYAEAVKNLKKSSVDVITLSPLKMLNTRNFESNNTNLNNSSLIFNSNIKPITVLPDYIFFSYLTYPESLAFDIKHYNKILNYIRISDNPDIINIQDEYFFKFLDMINNHPQGFLFMKDLSDILILNHDLRNQFITKYYDIIISY